MSEAPAPSVEQVASVTATATAALDPPPLQPLPPPPPTPPPKTKWPDAAPLDDEELIFSVSCGNSHLHWATHFGESDEYNPQIFWRTPHLKVEDMENEDFLAVLSRNLPDDPHDHIFGKSKDASPEDAVAQSKKRTVPQISVYVVSTNSSQEALLAKIWKTVPSRFFVMRGDDFFKKEEGRYDTMGTDRLATLTGAVHLHGHPALVFDGGTATTYSATDSDGKILGGGIGPGIQSKFRSLTKDTDALPEITMEEVIARVNEAQEQGKPLPTFARNTKEAMMGDSFQEFALKGRNVIEHWLEKSHKSKQHQVETTDEDVQVNTERKVLCTGGDGEILMHLLQPHYGGVIEHMASSSGANLKNGSTALRYAVESSKHLIHYGIACALAAQVSLRKRNDAFSKNPHEKHVDKRVAKHFEVEADDGDNIYRGKVVKVVENGAGVHEFRIQYDDGDSEDVTTPELFDMFKMFEVHGEKKTKKAAAGRGKRNTEKKKAAAPKEKKEKPAAQAATQMEETPSPQTASDKEDIKKAKSSDEKKRAEIPSFPMKSAKNKANGAPTDGKKPAAKRIKKGSSDEIVSLVNSSDPNSFVRKRVAKDFDGDTYFGTIMEYDDRENPAFWHAEYDDGDEEDYSKKDLIKALKYYQLMEKDDTGKTDETLELGS